MLIEYNLHDKKSTNLSKAFANAWPHT